MHTTPSNKRYIGITKQNTSQRWRNGNGYLSCPAFFHAVKKYGWDNIKHEEIDACETLEDANVLEQKYIKEYRTSEKRYGYNCTLGGDGVLGWRASEEQRKKNSNAKKEMWKTNITARESLTQERRERGATAAERERLRQMAKANWENQEMSEKLKKHLKYISTNCEMKERRVEAMKDIWKECPDRFMKNRRYRTGTENKRSKPIVCLETGAVYCNARNASEQTGIDFREISACATGRRKTTHATSWAFTTATP